MEEEREWGGGRDVEGAKRERREGTEGCGMEGRGWKEHEEEEERKVI